MCSIVLCCVAVLCCVCCAMLCNVVHACVDVFILFSSFSLSVRFVGYVVVVASAVWIRTV